MLPNVNTNDGHEVQERILVGRGGDLKALR